MMPYPRKISFSSPVLTHRSVQLLYATPLLPFSGDDLRLLRRRARSAESNGGEMSKKKKMNREGGSSSSTTPPTNYMDMNGQEIDMKSIRKDIESLGFSHMTWKQKKDLENRKVVALGGKPPKKQRLPLSVARVTMKKQKERDQKLLQENLILGRFGGKLGNGTKRVVNKHRPEDKVLKPTEGYFRNGVLDVKSLLKPAAGRESDHSTYAVNTGKKTKGGEKNRGKKNGGGKKRR